MIRSLLLILAALVCASCAFAHEVRPAYLELRQTNADSYDVVWKVPGRGDDLRFGVYVRLPDNCQKTTEVQTTAINNAFSDRWTVQCKGGITGGTIFIEGLSSSVIDVLVRIQRLDGTTQVTRLTPSEPSFTVEAAPSRIQLARTYVSLGVEHILYGIDHLLFVLGLMLLVRDFRSLVKTITAFTIAHSITLAAATLGFVHVEVAPVEATIALSILFLAAELVRSQRGESGIAQRAPWIVAFAFGLLHGLGFASTLGKMGLPHSEIPIALLLFNVGVELGQLGFVIVFIGFVRSLATLDIHWPAWTRAIPAYSIGAFAALTFLQRFDAIFWS
jgi:hydrogenase/urease accessory protein HupE